MKHKPNPTQSIPNTITLIYRYKRLLLPYADIITEHDKEYDREKSEAQKCDVTDFNDGGNDRVPCGDKMG